MLFLALMAAATLSQRHSAHSHVVADCQLDECGMPSPPRTKPTLANYYVSQVNDSAEDTQLSNDDSLDGDDHWTTVDAHYATTLASAPKPTPATAPWSPFYRLRSVGSSRYHLMRRARTRIHGPAGLDIDALD